MAAFLLWLILFILCWPLALLALIAYPFVWLILLPFRIVGIAVGGLVAAAVARARSGALWESVVTTSVSGREQ